MNGTPNHLLVNKVLDYPIEHFIEYTAMVYNELVKRGYNVTSWHKFDDWLHKWPDGTTKHFTKVLFEGWHDDRYLLQCFYNLQEKYDCGGIPEDEWGKIARYIQETEFKRQMAKYLEGVYESMKEAKKVDEQWMKN